MLDEKEVNEFWKLLTLFENSNLLNLTDEQYQKAINNLDMIQKLKLEGKIYAFHTEDSYEGEFEGIELYIRQGNTLKELLYIYDRGHVLKTEDITEYLLDKNISKIYTVSIPKIEEFLGLPQTCDEDDPITRDILEDYEIDQIRSEDIEVIVLDYIV